MKADDNTMIAALRLLANDLQSGDGVANACIWEAANRLEELTQWQPIERAKKHQLYLVGWGGDDQRIVSASLCDGQWRHNGTGTVLNPQPKYYKAMQATQQQQQEKQQ